MIDVIFHNATVITMDSRQPRAEAVLFRGRHVVTVGTLEECRRACVDKRPSEFDLSGRAVIPGFNDAHIHLVATGKREHQLQLSGMNRDEIIGALKSHATAKPGIIRAAGWDYESCPDPDIGILDKAFPDRPVILTQFSGHSAWVNSKALQLLGISKRRPTWPEGGAEQDQRGELTGILREPHYAPAYRKLSIRESRDGVATLQALQRAMAMLTSLGITSCGDNTWFPWHVDRIADLYHRGKQTVRINAWSYGRSRLFDRYFDTRPFRSEWYERGAHKFFADGAFSTYTAWLSEPYADRPETQGAGLSSDRIAPFLNRLTRRGRQVAIHSIGDAATHAILDAAEEVTRAAGSSFTERRHRIEHAQLVQESDIERIKKLGFVVSAQPHAAASVEKDERLLGAERAQRAYPFRTILDAGIPLAFSSDYPGEATIDPLYGVHLAVNRGSQAITPEEALRAYTAGGAYAEFAEDKKGTIASGYLADLAILSDDPTTVRPSAIKEIKVDATLVDGNLIHIREGVAFDTVYGISRSCKPCATPEQQAQADLPAGSFTRP